MQLIGPCCLSVLDVFFQITGGAGFVGSHLTDKLMLQGHEVTVVDNFFTGRKKNVEHWLGHENFELIHADIVNPIYIEGNFLKIMDDYKPHLCIIEFCLKDIFLHLNVKDLMWSEQNNISNCFDGSFKILQKI